VCEVSGVNGGAEAVSIFDEDGAPSGVEDRRVPLLEHVANVVALLEIWRSASGVDLFHGVVNLISTNRSTSSQSPHAIAATRTQKHRERNRISGIEGRLKRIAVRCRG
jgi:hypothetical protein